MDNKRSPVLIIFLCGIFLCTATAFYFLHQNEKKEKAVLQAELERSAAEQERQGKELSELQISASALNEKIGFQDQKVSDLVMQLEEARKLQQKTEETLAAKESKIEELRAKLRDAEKERQDLSQRLEKQYADFYDMKFQLSSLLKTKEELEKKAKELADNGPVSLGTIVIQQGANLRKSKSV